MGMLIPEVRMKLRLLRTKTDDEDAAQTFCREMFISRRQGRPEDHYRVLGVLGSLARSRDLRRIAF